MNNARLEDILAEAKEKIASATDLSSLDQMRIMYLGKKGILTEALKTLGDLPVEERPQAGQAVNAVKTAIVELLDAQKALFERKECERKLNLEAIDITMPGRGQKLGSLHPITQTQERLKRIFLNMGFDLVSGNEIETEDYNFEKLNIPPGHPARTEQDTFYFKEQKLLRTHTSPVQARYMETHQVPIRMLSVGRVYRRDFDATHSPMFHQLEGLVVDRIGAVVNFAVLKGMMIEVVKQFFDAADLQYRFRASYFPFTEPSAEMDIRFSAKENWLEVMGCGMVHPNVLRNVGIDPSNSQGFAFGIGIDRLAKLYFAVDDLRLFFENDLRFLRQF